MSGRVAFVTGASRGIGRAACLWLADVGFDVAAAARTRSEGASPDRRPDGAPLPGSIEGTAEAVRARGRRALALPLDLADAASIDAAFQRTLDEWQRIDVLVHNALFIDAAANARVLDVDLGRLSACFEANVIHPLRLTQRAVAAMLEQGAGRVVTVSSAAGRVDPPAPTGEGGWAFGYAAEKAALSRLAVMLHVELASRGVSAFNVEPGGVPTESFKAAFPPEALEQLLAGGAGHLVTEDVPAAAIAWLASSPEAVTLSGRTLDCERLCRERKLLPEDRIRF